MTNFTKYKNEYNKNNYCRISIVIPKEKKNIIEKLKASEQKSTNQLFISAVEKQYNINLSPEQNYTKYISKKIKILEELGYENTQELHCFLESVVENESSDNFDKIDAAFSAIINSNFKNKQE